MKIEFHPRLHEQIMGFEKLTLYVDPESTEHRIIGYNHDLNYYPAFSLKRGDRISEDFAKRILIEDCRRIAEALDVKHDWWRRMKAERQVALIHLGYAVMNRFTDIKKKPFALYGYKALLNFLYQGNFLHASNAILDSQFGTDCPDRARHIAFQIQTGEWV